MTHPNDITTTNGEVFTHAESALLAALVLRRFGMDVLSAAAAWRRMLQNSCTDEQFRTLAEAPRSAVDSVQSREWTAA